MGSFEGAVDPGIRSFGQFKEFAARRLDPAKHRKIAMFCTGGIRCEKASAYLLGHGFARSITSRAVSSDIWKACRRNRAAGAANVLCSTNGSRSAMACASAEPTVVPMSEAKTLSERVDALEMRLTFQDETIETLNQTISASCRRSRSA